MSDTIVGSPHEQLISIFDRMKLAYQANPMPSQEKRQQWLKSLQRALVLEKQSIVKAISQDFGNRSASETKFAEIMPSILAAKYAIKHLAHWMKPKKRHVSILFQPAKAKVVYQPLGVVGIMVPWNYPLFLSVGPLIGALAAGNRVMIKLSDASPNFSQALKKILADVFPEDLVSVFPSEPGLAEAFSSLPFDHLLFTGSPSVGKSVMQAAAKNLTPVTLELGGKSPAIIASDAPMDEAVNRIAFGKCMNAGQTCVAPDYVLVPQDKLKLFCDAYMKRVKKFYGRLQDNPDYTKIVNDRQLVRLQSYLEDAQAKGAEILSIFPDNQDRRMGQMLVLKTTDEMLIRQEEIFGPVLLVMPYNHIDEAIKLINKGARPLALYLFSYDESLQQKVLTSTHSGGVCINDTIMHVAQDDLPFGGVGNSGMGQYHAQEGFMTFSKVKPIFIKSHFNSTQWIYPPYGRWTHRLIEKLFIR